MPDRTTTTGRALAAAALVATLAIATTACASDDTAGESTTTVAPPPGEWSTFGYDLANTRTNPDEVLVSPSTASTLDVAWEVDGLEGVASTPAVVDGTVYIGDWTGAVRALDARTGEELWSTPTGDMIMSSVTIDGDDVYAASRTSLWKLDRATGEEQWHVPTSDHPIAITPSSPTVVDGHVLLGLASGELMLALGEYSFAGSVVSFDAETGAEQWRLWTTPNDDTAGAGVGVWSTASYDADLGLAYIGTGNTYEPPAAPLSDSLLAIELETGEVAWHHQFTYPDVWSSGNAGGVDGDVGAGPNLWDHEGRAMVGVGDKRGVYHALDRATGEVVWETEMTPGSLLGGVIGTSAVADGVIYVGSNVGDPASNGPTGITEVLALDAAGGEVLWRHEMDGAIYAPITTAPGLVYAASTSGTMAVLDAETGAELWSHQAPDQVGGGASVVDGTVYWGYGFSLFGSGGGKGGLYAFRPTGGGSSENDGDVAADDGDPGARLYRRSCASCHGPNGQGGVGPDLTEVEERLDRDKHVAIVANGKGSQMPAFDDALTEDEIGRIVDYERDQLGG